MLNFLNSIVLLGLVAGLIPLLIHLFTRRKLKKIEFSSLWFLKVLEKTRLKQVKLHNLLLLIIRTLIILLVVLAFARPAVKGTLTQGKLGAKILGGDFASAGSSSVVLILDDSYSMGFETKAGSLFELGKKKAQEILGFLTEKDEASLIFLSSPSDTSNFTINFKQLSERIDKAQLSYLKSNFFSSFNLAARLLNQSKNLNKEIYLITNKTPFGLDKLKQINSRYTLYLIDLSDPNFQNLAVDSLSFGNQLIELNKPFEIEAEIVNYTKKQMGNLLVGFYLDGKKVAQTDINIKAGEKQKVKFTYTVQKTGFHAGFIEIADDDLLADNYRYFNFKVPEQIKILLVGQRPEDYFFLNLALKPLENLNQNLKVKSILKGTVQNEDFSNYDVLVFSNLESFSDMVLTNLQRFLETGGGVWFILGENCDLKFYQEKIARKFFNLNLRTRIGDVRNRESFFSLKSFDLTHPLFAIYKQADKSKLPELKFYSIFDSQAGSQSKILANFSNNSPALVERKVESGKALLFLSGFDPELGDIAQHSFFVPFVNRAVQYLAVDLAKQNELFTVGEEISRDLAEIPTGSVIKLKYPNEVEEGVKPIFSGTKAFVKIKNSKLPGIYEIAAVERVLDETAFNIDPLESKPEKVDIGSVQKFFPSEGKGNLVAVSVDEDIKQVISRTRYGRELWREILYVVLVLLAVEMILGRTRPTSSDK